VSTADPTRVHKPARERYRPGHRGDRACDSSWWSAACPPTSPPSAVSPATIRRWN